MYRSSDFPWYLQLLWFIQKLFGCELDRAEVVKTHMMWNVEFETSSQTSVDVPFACNFSSAAALRMAMPWTISVMTGLAIPARSIRAITTQTIHDKLIALSIFGHLFLSRIKFGSHFGGVKDRNGMERRYLGGASCRISCRWDKGRSEYGGGRSSPSSIRISSSPGLGMMSIYELFGRRRGMQIVEIFRDNDSFHILNSYP